MRLIYGFVLFVFFILSFDLYAQEMEYYEGKVVDARSRTPLERAVLEIDEHILLLNSLGEFQVYVKPHDTLFFSHLGYKPLKIVITDSLSVDDLPQVVYLSDSNYTLDEVEVSRYAITNEMRNNMSNIVKLAVEQAKKKDGLKYEFTNPEAGVTGTGLSSQQMFGCNFVSIFNKIKESRKPKETFEPSTKIVSYEEYMVSQKKSVE